MVQKKWYVITAWWGDRSLMSEDENGILFIDTVGTLYPSYELARQAIRRSARYAKRMKYDWHLEESKIIPVIAHARVV